MSDDNVVRGAFSNLTEEKQRDLLSELYYIAEDYHEVLTVTSILGAIEMLKAVILRDSFETLDKKIAEEKEKNR